MFSKALFKQSMKANWVKWTCVTVATCVMLAIVIIALGSLAIDNIRDSLKGVFQQADQESVLKSNSVDSYELYLTTAQFENGVEMINDSGFTELMWSIVIQPNYNDALNEYQTTNPGAELTEKALEEIKNNAVNSAYDTIITILPSVMPDVDFTESELKQLLYIMMCAYEDNNSLSSAADIITAIENSYLQYVQDSAYEMYLQQEEANEETDNTARLAGRARASYAM